MDCEVSEVNFEVSIFHLVNYVNIKIICLREIISGGAGAFTEWISDDYSVEIQCGLMPFTLKTVLDADLFKCGRDL